MNIRLISGIFKNHKITAPNSRQTHPMSERARNAIFNTIQTDIPGAKILDAFAGTGALGLEAISRGAKGAVFIEKNRLAQKILAENLQITEKKSRIWYNKISSFIYFRLVKFYAVTV